MSIILTLLVIIVSILAYLLARRVPDEMCYLEKTIRVLQALSGLALLFILPWWLALMLAGALALGGISMAAAIGVLAALSVDGATAAIALPLAILAGARWELDKQQALHYVGITIVFALVLLGIKALGAF